MWTALPVAAFSIVTSFTALAIEASFNVSLPLASLIWAMTGVVMVGLVPNTKEPLPVSLVTAAARFAEVGVPKNVATPVPKLLNPVPPEVAANGVVAESVVKAPVDGLLAPTAVAVMPTEL